MGAHIWSLIVIAKISSFLFFIFYQKGFTSFKYKLKEVSSIVSIKVTRQIFVILIAYCFLALWSHQVKGFELNLNIKNILSDYFYLSIFYFLDLVIIFTFCEKQEAMKWSGIIFALVFWLFSSFLLFKSFLLCFTFFFNFSYILFLQKRLQSWVPAILYLFLGVIPVHLLLEGRFLSMNIFFKEAMKVTFVNSFLIWLCLLFYLVASQHFSTHYLTKKS